VATSNYKVMLKAGLLESLMDILSRAYKLNNKDLSKSKRVLRGNLIISILDLLMKKF